MVQSFTSIIRISRFFCGCIHHTPSDTAVICPDHFNTPEAAFLTGKETIKLPQQNSTPSKFQRTPRPHLRLPAGSLHNYPHNSLHTTVAVLDANGEEWSSPDVEQTGLCAACFIDHEYMKETRIAICECGKPDCSYRWCGDIRGLHAFWPIHANATSQQITGIADRDIFTQGAFDDLPDSTKTVLRTQQDTLQQQLQQAICEYSEARQPRANGIHPRTHRPVYLSAWLDSEYRAITSPDPNIPTAIAQERLARKLTRLIVAGAIHPDRHQLALQPAFQNALP